MFTKWMKPLKMEWERTVLCGMLMIITLGMFLAVYAYLSNPEPWQQSEQVPVVRLRTLNTDFSRKRFTPLPSHHAMRVDIPYTWKPIRVTPNPPGRTPTIQTPIPTPLCDKPPGTPVHVPTQEFLIYHGYLTAPNGTSLAFLQNKMITGDSVKQTGSYLTKGKQIKDLRVERIQKDWVELSDPQGKPIRLKRGTPLAL